MKKDNNVVKRCDNQAFMYLVVLVLLTIGEKVRFNSEI